jgi:hypothetical protein
MSKIRNAARNQPCSLRLKGCSFNNDETVLAHIRTVGVGMGRKPLDSMAVFACSRCHDLIDGRRSDDVMEKEKLERIIAGMAETHAYLVYREYLILK